MKQKNSTRRTFLFLLFLFPCLVFAQTSLKGKILDKNGDTVPFANVIEKGTTNGTTTDIDGKFTIDVPNLPATLVFSSLGYETVEQVVNTAAPMTINFVESAQALDEVVVTGLATSVKRSNSANAVASISAEDISGRTPPQTLDGALAGKFAGALVTKSSGAPGGGISVKLRGVTSINGNSQPLYIVDGVYVNNSSVSAAGLNAVSGAASGGNPSSQDNPSNRIADINPDDIESIEVLKGASAAAIYGSRAAAGVILITTKKGKRGETKVSLSQEVGFNTMLNPLGQRTYTRDIAEAAFGPGNGALFAEAQANGTLTNFEKEIYGEEGFINNTSVNVSGGSENTSFYAGFSNSEEDGIVKNTGYNRKSVRLNVEHKFLDKRAKISVSSNYINSNADRGFFNNDNTGTTIGVSLTSTPPWAQLFPDENGNYPDNPYGGSNPLQTRDLITNRETVNRFITGATLDFNIYDAENSSLKLQLRAGVDYYQLVTKAIFPKELQFQKISNGGLNGLSALGSAENKDANYSAFLVHDFNTDNDLAFTTQVGITKQTFSVNIVRNIATNLIGTETNLDQSGNVSVSQNRLEQEDAGFFAQEEINYQNKFIATLGVRGDKSSNNGDANKLFYYPKASLAVNFHEFDFWNNFETMNQFKIRGAYGEAGNFAPNGALFTAYGSSLIDGLPGIVVPVTLGDPTIVPERQKELEFGVDAGFFNNRLNLEATYYNKNVDDLVLLANNEPSSGFGSRWANSGNLENRGIELSLNADVVRSDNFNWSTTILYFKNESEITRLDVEPFNLGGFGQGLGTFRIEEGESATQIVGNNADGDLVVLGNAEPDFQMTFTNNFNYKNFDLSFLWHWKKGGDNINLSSLLTDFGQTSFDYDGTNLDPSGAMSNGDYRVNAFLSGNATPFVEDASYLRLREIGLFYTVPSKLIKSAFKDYVSNFKIGFSGNNLINIFDYNSYDPEVSNFGSNGLSSGVEVTPFPSSKRYLFHLAVDF
ncbi:SusC/RagA family TonB-linked outer membrane protein [Ulvibacter litoralis]|uniref:TonB-linked outer membrane protein, SusC/RagA family n=1 Tax=Ulvibacter litoralis TaxID=227084 RepID=A0A1G7DNG2_9FLAO|nr:SusC/RagA family TonB-linked outer membrane protein [Ulvibacter litoralis]SDE53028.1 TonB-linked outer membrane protein, SusC/RagA family [Ulvibacter litoralis]